MNLSLEVTTRNAVNLKAMDAQQRLAEILTPYIGRKARTKTGWGHRLAKQIDAWRDEIAAEGFRVWVSCSYSWLTLEIDARYNVQELVGGGHAVAYVKQQLTVGKVDERDGELLELAEPAQLRTDYTVDWVEATRAEAYRLECEARELRSSLRDFR